MNDNNDKPEVNAEATLTGTPAPVFKMNIDDAVKMLQNYWTQADKSLASLETNINNATNQVNEWKRIQLMLMGQKQLISDLLSKTVEAPKQVDAEPTSTKENK